jgi:alpha-mannosidase
MEPFITSDSSQILVGAVKPTEWQGSNLDQLVNDSDWRWDQETIIIRLIEQAGNDLNCNLQFNHAILIQSAETVNLLERNPSETLNVENNCINLQFRRFEIKTLRVKFRRNE